MTDPTPVDPLDTILAEVKAFADLRANEKTTADALAAANKDLQDVQVATAAAIQAAQTDAASKVAAAQAAQAVAQAAAQQAVHDANLALAQIESDLESLKVAEVAPAPAPAASLSSPASTPLEIMADCPRFHY